MHTSAAATADSADETPPPEAPSAPAEQTRAAGRIATLTDLQGLKAKPGHRTVREALASPSSPTSRGLRELLRVGQQQKSESVDLNLSHRRPGCAGVRHRRASGPAPTSRRGSRRRTPSRSAGGGSSGDPDSDEPAPGGHLVGPAFRAATAAAARRANYRDALRRVLGL
jgi:hypothetical protein